MNARTTRRSFLGAVVGAVGLLGAGRLNGALADKSLNHGDKASFESSCKQYGGEFLDSPKDKLTLCVWGDGSRTVCDQDGNDCENYPPPKPKPSSSVGGQNPFGGILGEIGEIPELAPEGPETGNAVEPEAGQAETKKRRRRGKRRKK